MASDLLLVDMSFGGIEQICRDVQLSNGGYLYLIDGSGELIYHPRQQLIYAGLLEENNRAAAGYSDGSHRESFQGRERQVTVKTVGYTGWKLVGVVPADSVWDNYGQLLLFFLFIVLFSIFLLVFVNLRLSEWITAPVKKLDQAVKELETGRQDVNLDVGGPHEVEHLSHSIRSMVSTMRHLMDDIIEQEEQKRRSELDVLQSQINPHFLYNTLDSVIWMTEAGRYDEAIQMVTSLARLFRISLSRGSSIITLADELEHARHYMNIQQIRYKNRFTTEITAEPGTEGLYTLKLIVQPILENAIYHGMSAAEDEGVISVRAYRRGDDLFIDVEDNGLGMRPEVAEQLLEEYPEQTAKLSTAAKAKRVNDRSNPAYRWVALAIIVAGIAAVVYGILALIRGENVGVYFALFGLAAIFFFSGAHVLPTAKNNKKAIAQEWERSISDVAALLPEDFPVPARYAHPVVLQRMIRVLREGRAQSVEEALNVMKKDLKALNASVQVEQEEYDEVVAIKPMFLLWDYE